MSAQQSSLRKPIQPLQRPPSLHKAILQAIRAYILDNELRPGDALPSENQLSEQLGISRNLVRECIRALESLGVVEIRRGSGIYVREFSFEPLLDSLNYGVMFDLQELKDVLDVRRALEDAFVEQAVEKMDSDQLARLERILESMRSAAELGLDLGTQDRAFHQALFENLGNQVLLKVIDAFWLSFHRANRHVDLSDYDPVWTYQLHVPIVEAIRNGQVTEARIQLAKHHASLELRLTRVMAKNADKQDSP